MDQSKENLFIIMGPEELAEFKRFCEEFPGKFCNPVLAKLYSYRRRILTDEEKENLTAQNNQPEQKKD